MKTLPSHAVGKYTHDGSYSLHGQKSLINQHNLMQLIMKSRRRLSYKTIGEMGYVCNIIKLLVDFDRMCATKYRRSNYSTAEIN